MEIFYGSLTSSMFGDISKSEKIQKTKYLLFLSYFGYGCLRQLILFIYCWKYIIYIDL
jgi:hypothetical protein